MSGTGIRFYRDKKKFSQAALADLLGVDGGTMSRLETGDLIPTARQVDMLVAALGVPPSHLFSKHVLAEVAERFRAAEAS